MAPPDFRLDGRCVLLTGSGRGIGLGIAQAMAAQGAAVAIQDIDQAVAETEAAAIRAAGGRAVALGGDITDLAVVAGLIEQARKALGGLHVLVNNAAIQRLQHWLEAEPADIERQLRANLVAPILLCRDAVAIFKPQRWGRIINLGSIQQLGGNPNMLPYSLSKAALVAMTKALARDLAADQITVNLIAPGWFHTHRNRGDFPSEEIKVDKGKRVPLGRIGEPADCAGACVLLCSPAGEYITGQSIHVDGGMSAR